MDTTLEETKKEKIQAMMTQKTGAHLLDSGGAYGRHWEKNQYRSFDDEPYITIPDVSCERDLSSVPYEANEYWFASVGKWLQKVEEVVPIVNIYHYFMEHLELSEDSLAIERMYYNEFDDEDTPHNQLLEEFAAHVTDNELSIVGDNTYNGENALSQDFQFRGFSAKGPQSKVNRFFIAIELHQGCDIRGGYSNPRFFECDFEELIGGMSKLDAHEVEREKDYDNAVLSNDEISSIKTGELRSWVSDDAGIDWYQDGCFNDKSKTLLPNLYYDDEDHTLYLADTMNTLQF